MKHYLRRALAAAGVIAIGAGVVPLLTASPAAAAGTLAGSASFKTAGGGSNLQSGNGDTQFTLALPSGAACPGDSTNDGYRWQTYMVPSTVDPATLTFGSAGPITPSTGTYSTFKQPLYTPAGSPVVNKNTADKTPPATTGPILGIPDFSFGVLAPGDIPAGVYNVGIACTLGPASSTQMKDFWNVQMTVSTDTVTGGASQIQWQNGTAPNAPTLTSLTPSGGAIQVAYTNSAANPALTNCHVSFATSSGGAEVTSLDSATCASPLTKTGLTNGQQYFVKVTATNAVGTSVASNELSATPINPAVTGLAATPSPNTVALDWNDAPSSPASYDVAYCTLPATSPCTSAAAGFVATTSSTTSNKTIGSLVAGQLYTFTVTYGAAGTSLGSSVQSTPLSNSILVQDITVGRPNGALVLTQVCGKYDAMAAEAAQFGYPTGLGASAASASGVAPTVGSGSTTDPEFSEYPYPENADGTANASYPTHCGISLGNAHLITKGGSAMGAGQFFAAEGRLNQVTIVDTRDTDPGWTVNFAMSDLSNGTNTISGNELGWTAQKTDTGPFLDGYGVSYDQDVTAVTPSLAPNTQGTAGASNARPVISAAPTKGLGISTLDARLKLLIPIHARNGNYTGTLTINAL